MNQWRFMRAGLTCSQSLINDEWSLFVVQRLREGVVRDLERLERRKENLRMLEEQRLLTRQLEEERHRREARLHPQDT